ncbi:MAG: A/G-specific adenine glycosylase [Gammaproteobacteria bacterium]|nr:A/G-specific adenine glycosylase [Gammaproteobacteria bacterium]
MSAFSQKVLTWFKKHGRKDLPWQQDISPYRVWVSEIMLQQTQVSTVIPYYERFMKRFPDVKSLAKASEDQVLHLWTGLGYYARARNLHRAAKIIVTEFNNTFPDTLETLQLLPGIGRSTAGAILSISFQKPAAVLDGNVKRVLSRYLAVNNLDMLWNHAEAFVPQKNPHHYAQAMMDLGAMICTRTKPKCELCPLEKSCEASLTDRISEFPTKKSSKILPVKQTILLVLKNKTGEVLLEKRPSRGIWGGLWSLPEFVDTDAIRQKYPSLKSLKTLQSFRHTFSHYHLDITPMEGVISSKLGKMGEEQGWFDLRKPTKLGFSAPVKKILGGVLDA